MRIILSFALVLGLVSCGSSDESFLSDEAKDVKPTISLIGDSISAGVFASTKIGKWPASATSILAKTVKKMKIPQSGSEFAKNFREVVQEQNDLHETDKRALSTDDDWGLRAQVAKTKENLEVKDVKTFISARFGASYSDFESLLNVNKEKYKKIGADFRPSHVIVMLGANDFCDGTSPAEFRKKVTKSFATLAAEHPNSRIVVATMPPFMKIKKFDCSYEEEVKTDAIKIRGETVIEAQEIKIGISCDDIRKASCPDLYKKGAAERLKEMDEIILSQRGTEAGSRVTFAEMNDAPIEEDDMAFDGFHPNVGGQKVIAKILGEAMIR